MVYAVSLNTDLTTSISDDSYSFNLIKAIDSGVVQADASTAFTGGNADELSFVNSAGVDLVLSATATTTVTSGKGKDATTETITSSGTINTSTGNGAGVNGQTVGEGETLYVSYREGMEQSPADGAITNQGQALNINAAYMQVGIGGKSTNTTAIRVTVYEGGPSGSKDEIVSIQVTTSTGDLIFTVPADGLSTTQGGITVTADGDSVIVSGLHDGDMIQVTGDANGYDTVSYTWDSGSEFSLQYLGTYQSEISQAVEMSFDLTATDVAGNTTAITDAIQVTAYPAATTLVSSTDQSEVLLGTDGDDVFEWSLADRTADGDVIQGFTEGSDVIDLGDLLTGYDSGDDLSSFIQVTTQTAADGTTNTIITVDSDGDGSAADQTITIEGVDWVGTETDMNTILNNLISSGKLIDPDSGG